LTEAVDHVKTQLMPDFDFDAYNHDEVEGAEGEIDEMTADVEVPATNNTATTTTTNSTDEVDKW
jgi:hypothetical protein